jgi:hypothetical protein
MKTRTVVRLPMTETVPAEIALLRLGLTTQLAGLRLNRLLS